MTPFVRIAGMLLAATAMLAGAPLYAQDYPNKPIRFIVPSTAATTNDGLTRIVTLEMAKLLGQPIVVENRSGANQIIGVETVARAAPDGYTVGILGADGVAFMPVISAHLRFDPFKDIVPVATVAESRYVLAGPSARPWKSFRELMAHAKANPGKLNYGSSAPQVRYGMLLVLQKMGVDMAYIPYSGGGPYLTALAAGTVDVGIAGDGTAAGLGDRVQIFAITGKTRSPRLPNVPTFDELGVPNVFGPTYTLFVPAGTPRPVVDKLTGALEKALQNAEVKAALEKLALDIVFDKGDGPVRSLNERAKAYADFAKAIGLKPE